LQRLEARYFEDDVDALLFVQLKNLTSLSIHYHPKFIPMLTLLGPKLTELKITPSFARSNAWFHDGLKVFELCPKLELFHMNFFDGDVDFQVPFDAHNLKLKNVLLEGDFALAEGFLPLILTAPLLEEVELDLNNFTETDIEVMLANLELRSMFQNVTRVNLGCFTLTPLEVRQEKLECFERLA